jgi:hypothetical protein
MNQVVKTIKPRRVEGKRYRSVFFVRKESKDRGEDKKTTMVIRNVLSLVMLIGMLSGAINSIALFIGRPRFSVDFLRQV